MTRAAVCGFDVNEPDAAWRPIFQGVFDVQDP